MPRSMFTSINSIASQLDPGTNRVFVAGILGMSESALHHGTIGPLACAKTLQCGAVKEWKEHFSPSKHHTVALHRQDYAISFAML